MIGQVLLAFLGTGLFQANGIEPAPLFNSSWPIRAQIAALRFPQRWLRNS